MVQTWGERMAAHTAEQRLLMTLLVVFGAAAGLLAALGVYGLVLVVSRAAHARAGDSPDARREAGQRRYARDPSERRVDCRRPCHRARNHPRSPKTALTRVLFEMSPRDPASLAAACALLVVVALVACVPPALRALRVDPVDGLRAE